MQAPRSVTAKTPGTALAVATFIFEAHRISHVVKDRLMERYPQIPTVS
jgi:hypothetical protein